MNAERGKNWICILIFVSFENRICVLIFVSFVKWFCILIFVMFVKWVCVLMVAINLIQWIGFIKMSMMRPRQEHH